MMVMGVSLGLGLVVHFGRHRSGGGRNRRGLRGDCRSADL